MNLHVEKIFQDRRTAFIKKVKELLPFYEWNEQLIAQAENESNFGKCYHLILFPEGIDQIIEAYEGTQDQKMLELLMDKEPPAKIREKIAQALKIRIKNCSSKTTLKKNRNYLSKPQNLAFASKIAWSTCDIIWRFAGDNSIDFNHYSKRSLLLSVYLSSIIFYLNDESKDHIKTDNFIDESLTKIINIASFKKLWKLPKLEDIPILRLFS